MQNQHARDEAGNIWEVDAQGNPVRLIQPAGGGQSQTVGTPDPRVALERTSKELAIQAAMRNAARAPTQDALDQIRLKREQLALDKDQGPVLDPKLDAFTGTEYLKHLPPATASQVQALANGRMAFPSGAAMRSPYWQTMLSHVAHYDPEFDGVNYQARQKTRSDFTSGKSSQNIKALNTALGHLGQLNDQIAGTASHGGFPFATTVNAIENSISRGSGSSGITKFEQTAGALSSELTQVFRGSGGAEADIKRYLSELSSSASAEQKTAAVRNIAGLLKSRLEAIGDQYTKGMGTTAQPLVLLDPHAQKVFGSIMGAPDGGGTPPDGGPPGGGTDGGGLTTASGSTRTERDDALSAMISTLIRKGATADEINASLPPGATRVDAAKVSEWQRYLRKHPEYKGAPGAATREVPNTLMNRISGSGVGTFLGSTADSAMGGLSDEFAGGINSLFNGKSAADNIADLDAKKQAAFAASPKAAFTGSLTGNALSMLGAGKVLEGGKIATALGKTAPYVGSSLWGALSGAGQANNNRVGGAVAGGIGGAAGQALGDKIVAPVIGAVARTAPVQTVVGKAKDLLGQIPGINMSALPRVPAPSSAEQAIGSAVTKANPADSLSQLSEASAMGLPMSIADTHPELRELAAAAVRRSPTASRAAEESLLPRARGQIDRFGAAVNRELGPVANIPQVSEDLTQAARTQAGPLYDAALSRSGASSVKLDDLMERPSMQAGLSRAYRIAKEEGRDPTTLGFNLTDHGEVVLSRTPSFQTLHYVKMGLDDALESHRSELTGKLVLTPDTRAINSTKATLLGRMDKANPDYAAARKAYAGPVQARDALARGQDAFSLHPDELAMQVANQTPEHLDQMQAGYRSALMSRANAVRDTSNPFEATLAPVAAQQRLSTMFPNNPGVQRLLQARELERKMSDTTNAVFGNSRTAQRGIADASFAAPDVIGTVAGAGVNLATGGGAGALAESAIKRGLRYAGDKITSGRAVAKADAIAPVLLNPDPQASAAAISAILDQIAKYNAFRNATTPRASMGRAGAAFGMTGGTALAR